MDNFPCSAQTQQMYVLDWTVVDWKLSTEMCQSTGQYRYQKKCGIISSTDTVLRVSIRVKSGNFRHQVNSHVHLQIVEIQMRRLLMSHLIRIFTVCLVNLCFIPVIKT